MSLKKEVQIVEDRPREVAEHEAASREAAVLEIKQQAINKFKQSEGYKALQDYNADMITGMTRV